MDSNKQLDIIVVIPCYNEPNVMDSINCLLACDPPSGRVEIVVVVNYPESASPIIKQNCIHNFEQVNNTALQLTTHPHFIMHCIVLDNVPDKLAGVGYARLQGMNYAADRLENNLNGLIISFDADALCSTNYLNAIEKAFKLNKNTYGASINFEHPTSGLDFEPNIYHAIEAYELHLRYYKQALAWIQVPYAFHTIGSSMACTARAYKKVGGMNKRKAGEDFYFLQKLIALGNFIEINNCTVYPSPRPSNRVPFGTGRAVNKFIEQDNKTIPTYQLSAFVMLKKLIDQIPTLYQSTNCQQLDVWSGLDPILSTYIDFNEFANKINECNKHSSSPDSFEKRFFTWFDAFACFKILNQIHTNKLEKADVYIAAKELLDLLNVPISPNLLQVYRQLDRNELQIR